MKKKTKSSCSVVASILLALMATSSVLAKNSHNSGGYVLQHDQNKHGYMLTLQLDQGTCNATLIAPSWIITAQHCAMAAKLKLNQHQPVVTKSATAQARNNNLAQVKDIFYGHNQGVDIALMQLDLPINHIEPVSLSATAIKSLHGRLPVTLLAQPDEETNTLIAQHNYAQGKGGKRLLHNTSKHIDHSITFSGSPIMLEDTKYGSVQIAVNHGGGLSLQPQYVRQWITQTMRNHSQEQPKWVAVSL